MRSASLRCAIEKIAMRGLPSGVYSSRPMSSGSPSSHASKPGRREQVVQRHREFEAILRRIERLEIEHADARRPAAV